MINRGSSGEKSASSGDFIHPRWITLGISPSRLTGPGDARHSAPTPQTEPAKYRRGRRHRGNSGAAEPEGEKREAGETPGTVEAPTGPSESGKPGRGDTGGDEPGDRGGVGEGADVRPSFSGTGRAAEPEPNLGPSRDADLVTMRRPGVVPTLFPPRPRLCGHSGVPAPTFSDGLSTREPARPRGAGPAG